jgi:O-antigen ligase
LKLLQRAFLLRRRWDRGIAWLGAAGLPLRHGITIGAASFFALVGLYLIALRPRSRRLIAGSFLLLSVSYFFYSLALALFRGEPVIDNRQLSYSLIIGLLAFIANGMVLVRDPLRCFVIGARAGTVVCAAIALLASNSELDRFGMGGNPAPFAMLAAFALVAAIIPIANAPRWAPNSLIYVLVGGISVFASQTRAVLMVLPVILAVESIIWLRGRSFRLQLTGYVAGAAALGLAVSVGPIHTMLAERFVPIVQYYSGDHAAWDGSATADLRFAMWKGFAHAFVESPIIGHGSDRMERVVALAPTLNAELREFQHIHNIVLDELLQHGILGLLILAGVIVSGAAYAIRHADSNALKRNIAYALLVLVVYGMFHNPMLHESTIAAVFFYLGVTIAHGMRCQAMARRRMDGPVLLFGTRAA